MKKCIISILVILVLVWCVGNISYALTFTDADAFIETGKNNNAGINLTEIGTEFSAIGNVLVYIGAGILVGATAYMGILYIVSSPEKQAKLKQQLIGLVVSAIVIFGAYSIWSMIITLLESAT